MPEPKRVLVVEDDIDIAESVAELLRGEGYEIAIARDGQEAIHILRSSEPQPGLILLDLMMPVMDGIEFRIAQRQDPRVADTPVLLMSAGGDLPTRALEMGARGYLRKPFKDIATLLDAVGRFF